MKVTVEKLKLPHIEQPIAGDADSWVLEMLLNQHDLSEKWKDPTALIKTDGSLVLYHEGQEFESDFLGDRTFSIAMRQGLWRSQAVYVRLTEGKIIRAVMSPWAMMWKTSNIHPFLDAYKRL